MGLGKCTNETDHKWEIISACKSGGKSENFFIKISWDDPFKESIHYLRIVNPLVTTIACSPPPPLSNYGVIIPE